MLHVQTQQVPTAGSDTSTALQWLSDSRLERALSQISRLAALTCEVSVAAIELIHRGGPCWHAQFGWSPALDSSSVSLVQALDAAQNVSLFKSSDLIVISDLTQDPGAQRHAWVVQPPHARFLASAPLIALQGDVLGFLVLLDPEAKTLSSSQRESLAALADQAAAQLQLQTYRHRDETTPSRQKKRDPYQALFVPNQTNLYQQILDVTQEGIWVLEGPYTPVYVNQQMADMLGYAPSELMVGAPHRFVAPRWRKQVKRALEQLTPDMQEICWRRRDGSLLWSQVSVRSITTPDRERQGLLMTVADITIRKRTEDSLRQLNGELEQRVTERTEALQQANLALHTEVSERKITQAQLRQERDLLSRIMETSPAAIMMLDNQGRIRFANAQAESIFGLLQISHPSEHDATNSPCRWITTESGFSFSPQSDLPFHQVMQTRHSVFNQLICFAYPPGQRTDLLVNAAPLLDSSGQITSVIFVMQDITEQFRIQQAQQESEARFHQIVQEAPIGITLVLPDGRLSEVNQAFCRMLGYEPEDLLGADMAALTYPQDRVKEETLIQQVLRREAHSCQITKRFLRKDQTLVWAQVTSRPLVGPDDKVRYTLAMIEDITERQAVERMKDEFISMVSHELRTPLTSIHGSLSLMATGRLGAMDPKGQRLLNIAVANTERLVRLINDILDLDRIESGVVSLQKRWCNAADLMHQAVETMQTLADRAQIQLVVRPLSAELWVDADRILQTLTNLLSNAIRFSPPHTQVTLEASFRGEDQIRFAVTDQGRGIPPENLERIFERFQQVDSSDARKLGGTGLGLPICRSIVRQHGGRIWAESIVDRGSTFYFTLPLLEVG